MAGAFHMASKRGDWIMDLIEMLRYYIRSELLVVIPVLYLLGRILKRTKLSSKRIPWILLVVSLVITALYTFSVCNLTSLKEFYACLFSVITQGILLTGASMFVHEVTKGLCASKPDEKSKSSETKEEK